jgi:hypothetical protein
MGGIVKSIGRAIKKVGKGISKLIKRIAPALIIAAAVWAGVSILGAHSIGTLAAEGIRGSIFSAGNFGAGLGTIGKGVANFFMPGTFPGKELVGYKQVGDADFGTFKLEEIWADKAGNKDMTTSQALMYMTKMNLFATGAQTLAGLLDDSDEKEAALKYAYGGAVTKGAKKWVDENPDYMSSWPSRSGEGVGKVTPDWYQQQSVGEPTIGRSSTKQYMSPSPSAIKTWKAPGEYSSPGKGLITQAAQKRYG